MQYRDNSTSVTASCIRGYPSYSRTTRPRGAKSSAGHAPVKCIGCISPRPRSSRSPPRTNTRASHRAHASSCICMFNSSPLLGPSCPSGTTSSLFLSLSLFLSRHLFLRFSTGLFPLSVARLVELFFVCRASPLYRCYAPTTASGVPTGERVTTFAPNIRLLVHEAFVIHRSLLRIAWHSELRASHAHRAVRLRFARASTRDPGGANRTRLFEINILVPRRGGRPVARSMPASAVASRREALTIFIR